MKKNMTVSLFFLLSPITNCPCECDGKSNKLVYKLPNTRVFVAAENRLVEVLKLVAFFLVKTGTSSAKDW